MTPAIDSNILIYAYNTNSIFHEDAKELLLQLKSKDKIAISEISLIEFYQVSTDKKKLLESFTENEASGIIKSIKTDPHFEVLPIDTYCIDKAFSLVGKYGVKKYEIYDLLIAVTCNLNRIECFYTAQ